MPLPPRAVLVTGSRHWPAEQRMRAESILGVIIEPSDFVIHGGAHDDPNYPDTLSIDALADKLADELGCQKKIVRPNYAAFRGRERAAPMARNSDMVALLDRAREKGWDTLCIALIHQQSRGSTDCSGKAWRAGHATRTFTTDQNHVPPRLGRDREHSEWASSEPGRTPGNDSA